jgi:transposase-like protein
MKQRKWTGDEKLAIVDEGLKEKRSGAEICREQRIS